jgi:Fe-S-cluster-containing hydrogenase component 2
VSVLSQPLHSLKIGSWFKLICGASYQHHPGVRNLALAYSLAGADCIDIAADPAVIAAAREGIRVATELGGVASPWLMVSINDAEDPHFRKAEFDATQCPSDCLQPCVTICPAKAIAFGQEGFSGVVDNLCYGCGRCLPVCPPQLIATRSHISSVQDVVFWLDEMAVDAIEIHTQVGHYADFQRVWQQLGPRISQLKLLAISCTDAPNLIDYLHSLNQLIQPLPIPLIWQTDGRSMSGDIGKGTTHAAIAVAKKVLQASLPGYVQLAGGTNNYTVTKLQAAHMVNRDASQTSEGYVCGVGYGSYARSLLLPILEKLSTGDRAIANLKTTTSMNVIQLEKNPELLEQAVSTAKSLVTQIKSIA